MDMEKVKPTYEELLEINQQLSAKLEGKQAIEKLASDDFFSAFFYKSPVTIFISEPETDIIIDVNDSFLRDMEYTKEEVIGKSTLNLAFYPQLNEREYLLQSINKNGKISNYECTVKTKSGKIVFGLLSIVNVQIYSKIFRLNTLIDITERKLVLEDLKKAKEFAESSEERFRIMINNSNDIVGLFSAEGNQFYLSKAAERITGYTCEELYGPFARVIHPDDLQLVGQAWMRVLENKNEVVSAQYRHIHKDKDYIWLEAIGQNFLDNPAINAIVINTRDITEHKNYENALIEAKEKAELSDRLKSAFLNNISHEVRTPLNSIIGFSQLIVKPNQKQEKLKLFSKLIRENSERLVSVITDVIEVSQIQSNLIKVNISGFDVCELINSIAVSFEKIAKDKKIDFKVEGWNTNEVKTIHTDKEKLQRIIIHLVDNAIKFTKDGSVMISCNCEHGLFTLKVADTGIGMSEETQKVIYQPFRQNEIGTNRSFGGAGLGLSITKSFTELLNGKIVLRSEKNKGTTFEIQIPLRKDEKIKLKESKIIQKHNLKNMLIAEDEYSNYQYLAALLEDSDYNILYAQNGNDAVEICKNNSMIDLILMDIKMPIMDGYTAAKLIKEFRPNISIIAQTAYALESEMDNFANTFDDYITKPISEDVLLNTLKKFDNSHENIQ